MTSRRVNTIVNSSTGRQRQTHSLTETQSLPCIY